MAVVLAIRLSPGKLARIAKRAAELGQDRSAYVRKLIDEDLKNPPKASKHVFASEDLVGCVRTGLKRGDNATVRKVMRERLQGRHAKHR
jgi:hypothetical protein